MRTFEEYLVFAKANDIEVTDFSEITPEPDTYEAFDAWTTEIEEPDITSKGTGKLAILLHGFNPMGRNAFSQADANAGRYADYQKFFDALKARLTSQGYFVTVAAYDTHQSFATAGDNLRRVFEGWSRHYDLSKTVIVGYSMGGVVARQMVAGGLPFARLYTTCTPHRGVMPYLAGNVGGQYFFSFNKGAMSMWPTHPDLVRLNASDIHLHNKYYVHGVNYTDLRLFHNDDTITDCDGATMVGYKVAKRWASHIGLLSTIEPNFGSPMPIPFQPHLRGYLAKAEWNSTRWMPEEFVRKVDGV